MKTAVICAMPEEAEKLRSMLTKTSSEQHAGTECTKGIFAGQEVVLCISDIGKANAAATTQMVIDTFAPDILLNIGLAGSCSPDLPISGVVVANRLMYHDFYLIFDEQSPFQSGFTPDEDLSERAAEACRALDLVFKRGVVATGDQFIADEDVKADIIERTEASCVEMEGAAIAHIAQKNGVPYASVKVMSDDASKEALEDFYEVFSLGAYCERSAAIIGEILRSLERSPRS